MKKLLISALLLLSVHHAAIAQTSEEPDALFKNDYAEDKAEIRNLVYQLYESIKEKDFERSKTFHVYGDKFTAFYSGNKRVDAEGAIEFELNLHERIPEGVQFDIEDLEVNVFDKTAVASFHIYVTSMANGEEKLSQAQVTLVYVKTNGQWKITHEHVSSLAQARE